jgi:hypothetical protein
MRFSKPILWHPRRRRLMVHAESLHGSAQPVSAALAAHVAACSSCRKEVNAMRGSLKTIASAASLEPSSEMTAQLLLRAKEARSQKQRFWRERSLTVRRRPRWRTAAAGVAALLLFAGIVGGAGYQSALVQDNVQTAEKESAAKESAAKETAAPEPMATASTAFLDAQTVVVRQLSAALNHGQGLTATPREWAKKRVVRAMDADVSAAMAALQRNPGCARAVQMARSGLEQQTTALRELYTASDRVQMADSASPTGR